MSTGRSETAPRTFGPEEITAEDREYAGSTYQEVREALFANPYYAVWGAPGGALHRSGAGVSKWLLQPAPVTKRR